MPSKLGKRGSAVELFIVINNPAVGNLTGDASVIGIVTSPF